MKKDEVEDILCIKTIHCNVANPLCVCDGGESCAARSKTCEEETKTTQLKNKKTMMMMMILIIMSVLVQPTTPSRAYRYYSYSEIIQNSEI